MMQSLSLITTALVLFVGVFRPVLISAFTPVHTSRLSIRGTPLSAKARIRKPTLNKKTQRWEAAPGNDEEAYGPFGSFLRQGPPPFLTRIKKPTLNKKTQRWEAAPG